MTDKDKIEFLLKILKDNKMSLNVEEASALLQSYRWLIDKLKEEGK